MVSEFFNLFPSSHACKSGTENLFRAPRGNGSPDVGNESSIPAVRTILRRMHPAAQTFLVAASDGASYVMRVVETGDAAPFLFREALGYLLGTHLGLPMASWSPLLKGSVKEPSIQDHAEGYVFFGYRLPETSGALYEHLPTSWLRGTEIAREMTRIQVFDNWVAQFLPRQYVAFRNPASEALQIEFIRNASILDAAVASGSESSSGISPYARAVRLGVEATVVDEMIGRIESVTRHALEKLVGSIPEHWVHGAQAEFALHLLAQRQSQMARMQTAWRRSTSESSVKATQIGQKIAACG